MVPESTLIVEPAGAARDAQSVARLLDSTLLRTDVSREQVIRLCAEAVRFGFASVFVHPYWVPVAVGELAGTAVAVGTPVGFPYGAALTSIKCAEAEAALRMGARELDMVMNVGALRSGDRQRVELDIRSVAEIAHGSGAILKVILEMAVLVLEEKLVACELAVAAGADFVKSGTGLHGPATADDIHLMRGVVGERCGVKAAGGIRTLADVQAMVAAGANRIGTSTAAAIMGELGA
jgi:deoxyribose-phosphate aldolase